MHLHGVLLLGEFGGDPDADAHHTPQRQQRKYGDELPPILVQPRRPAAELLPSSAVYSCEDGLSSMSDRARQSATDERYDLPMMVAQSGRPAAVAACERKQIGQTNARQVGSGSYT